jgi:hypothetical protein
MLHLVGNVGSTGVQQSVAVCRGGRGYQGLTLQKVQQLSGFDFMNALTWAVQTHACESGRVRCQADRPCAATAVDPNLLLSLARLCVATFPAIAPYTT